MKLKPYTKFAEVYDRLGADDHSIKMVEYCRKIFRKFNITPTTGLDLCCGTGAALDKLSRQGIIMSGLDRSPHMLAMAALKLRGRNITLYQKCLPKFRLLDLSNSRKTQRFDVVTCFFDSLNYLKNLRELKTAFKSVYNHLQPGGWFIFDMNTPAAMKILWGGQVFAEAQDDVATIWKNEYDEKTKSAACQTTFFLKAEDHWQRFDEVHIERAYENAEIKKALRDSGFLVKGFYRCFSFEKPAKGTYRVCGVAKKPA